MDVWLVLGMEGKSLKIVLHVKKVELKKWLMLYMKYLKDLHEKKKKRIESVSS